MKNHPELIDSILAERFQPKLQKNSQEIIVAIASLAIGGAEMIVTDWLNRTGNKNKVHLIVLRNKEEEWEVPYFVKVTRIENEKQDPKLSKHENRILNLKKIGQKYSVSGGTTITCHLLSQEERLALKNKSNYIVYVLHNAKVGWNEKPSTMIDIDFFVCVSDNCANDLIKTGLKTPFTVIKHIPKTPVSFPDTKRAIKEFLGIPKSAKIVGMIGSFKKQKNYLFAIKIFENLIKKNKNTYLVILGGTSSLESEKEMYEIVQYLKLNKQLQKRVKIPGAVKNASAWTSAFDLFLNTSFFEGLSIATLESMSLGIPCLISKVGGQGEITSQNTELLDLDQSIEIWTEKILAGIKKTKSVPQWAGFPSFNLWTIVGRLKSFKKIERSNVLFITSNLNLGGAQRSLVNLLTNLNGERIKLTVAGNSTTNHFLKELIKNKIEVVRSSQNFDCYENASNIITDIYNNSFNKIVFWNVDPKLKILLVKFLCHDKNIKLIDVSPGHDSYHDMKKIEEFSNFVSFPIHSYYKNLKYLVSKFKDKRKSKLTNYRYIPNGVSNEFIKKESYNKKDNFKIVVSGRIVNTKFTLEILEAFYLVLKDRPGTELHFYGSVTESNDYINKVKEKIINLDIKKAVHFHGKDFNVMNKLHNYDLYIVLGINQGSPNALMEAMSVGMPCITNDSGGCREIIKNNKNGIIIRNINVKSLSKEIIKLLTNDKLRGRLGKAATQVTKTFSLQKMSARYRKLLSL